MAAPKDIEVFFIAKTAVDRDAVARWLQYLDVETYEPPLAGVTDPALLVAIAAKRCYKSFEVSDKLNPNLTRVRDDYTEYLDNVLKVGHGSVLEHAVYTLAIEGVTRVFTAEMNRHRAGWAISEGSLRFIRFGENVPYWLPSSIRGPDLPDPVARVCFENQPLPRLLEGLAKSPLPSLEHKKEATRVLFQRAFSHQQEIYRAMEAIWAEELQPTSAFKDKKAITSLMRRIVGLGVSTGGVWSGNIRALRHVLTMRCAPEAEEEILYTFSLVAKMLRDQEPMLFGDFYQDERGFWRPKYVKV